MAKTTDSRIDIDLKQINLNAGNYFNSNVFHYVIPLSVKEFSDLVKKDIAEIIKYFFLKGVLLNINSILTKEQTLDICFNYEIDFKDDHINQASDILANIKNNDKTTDLINRAPVVAIMGHVDHGKTTLLDKIRLTNVVKDEAGGITQHIGAYQIFYQQKPITFLDTPGHEVFNNLRVNGGSIADIVVLVIAADDGFKPQTIESIKIAQSYKCPIIVFINKIDKNNNVDKILNDLVGHKLTPEEWGGDTMIIKGSAINNINIDKLLDAILTLAEMRELKTNPLRYGQGYVIESTMEKGLGACATIILRTGTMNVGDFIIIGSTTGNIRLIFDENNKQLKSVGAGKPVKITGLSKVPLSGTNLIVSQHIHELKELAKTIENQENIINNQFNVVINENNEQTQNENDKVLNIILKTDVYGTINAIKGLIEKINVPGAKANILRASVGGITDNDINIAKTSNAIIIGFNVKPLKDIRDLADRDKIKILFYNIVYKLSDDIEKMLANTLPTKFEERETGEARIQQLWSHSAIGTIAGCKVTSGEIKRSDSARILRKGIVLHQTKIKSLKHVKEVIDKAVNGMEFGITFLEFNDLQVDDIIQSYELIAISNEK